jgi:hypothetical protein
MPRIGVCVPSICSGDEVKRGLNLGLASAFQVSI